MARLMALYGRSSNIQTAGLKIVLRISQSVLAETTNFI
jgi:hypothetical protein